MFTPIERAGLACVLGAMALLALGLAVLVGALLGVSLPPAVAGVLLAVTMGGSIVAVLASVILALLEVVFRL